MAAAGEKSDGVANSRRITELMSMRVTNSKVGTGVGGGVGTGVGSGVVMPHLTLRVNMGVPVSPTTSLEPSRSTRMYLRRGLREKTGETFKKRSTIMRAANG